MLRPLAMEWVDILMDKDSVAVVLEVLAGARIIELRRYDRCELPFEVKADAATTERLRELERRVQPYLEYLPAPDAEELDSEQRRQPSAAVLPDLDRQFGLWADRVGPLVQRLRVQETALEEYALLEQCLSGMPEDEDLHMELWAESGDGERSYPPFLAVGTLEDVDELRRQGVAAVVRAYPYGEETEKRVLLAGVTAADALPELERLYHARGLRFARVPSSLSGSPGLALSQLADLIAERTQERDRLKDQIAALNREMHMDGYAWLLRRHLWISTVMQDCLGGETFVWLGGWVPENRHTELADLLDGTGVPYLIQVDVYGDHGAPPVALENPRWMRRFEVFVRGFGVPAANEVDPSPLLAVMTPLMFGYMFGDVGHGAVLMLIGWAVRRRLPILSLLIPAGFSSIVFGFLFGSVFSNEHLIPALWLHPLHHPLLILGVPVVFGGAAILTSMLLAGVQEHWRGQGAHWWGSEFPVVMMYVAIALAFWSVRAAVWLGLIAAVWLFGGAAVSGFRARGAIGALSNPAKRLVEMLEVITQLIINTISFARLGAFALAHAGLSTAVMALTEMPDPAVGRAILYVLGNALVIALEGLVVSIQTTRLVMFEFFRRFVSGQGRVFQPLSLPTPNNPSAMVS